MKHEVLKYLREAIDLGAVVATSKKGLWSRAQYERARLVFPHCLDPQEFPGKRLILNRDYKPLGEPKDAWYDYGRYEHLTIPELPLLVQLCDHERDDRAEFLWYEDNHAPWNSRAHLKTYLGKLVRLQSALQPDDAVSLLKVSV